MFSSRYVRNSAAVSDVFRKYQSQTSTKNAMSAFLELAEIGEVNGLHDFAPFKSVCQMLLNSDKKRPDEVLRLWAASHALFPDGCPKRMSGLSFQDDFMRNLNVWLTDSLEELSVSDLLEVVSIFGTDSLDDFSVLAFQKKMIDFANYSDSKDFSSIFTIILQNDSILKEGRLFCGKKSLAPFFDKLISALPLIPTDELLLIESDIYFFREILLEISSRSLTEPHLEKILHWVPKMCASTKQVFAGKFLVILHQQSIDHLTLTAQLPLPSMTRLSFLNGVKQNVLKNPKAEQIANFYISCRDGVRPLNDKETPLLEIELVASLSEQSLMNLNALESVFDSEPDLLKYPQETLAAVNEWIKIHSA